VGSVVTQPAGAVAAGVAVWTPRSQSWPWEHTQD